MAEDNICDWCGAAVDEEDLFSELSCRRANCGRQVYHQACIEDHLRKCKLAPDRLSGFPCPRGLGRGRRGDAILAVPSEPCKGTIDSTHKKIAKNKAKKAQVAQSFYVPPPKPVPGAKKKVPQQAPPPAQPAPTKVVAKPTPVRAGVGPSHNKNGAPEKTKAQMLAMVATLRKEIKGAVPPSAKDQSAAAKPAVKPAAAAPATAAAAVKVQPGAGAAARLGKQQQPVYIPGMEPADPIRRPAKTFNLHEQKSAFPTLEQAVANIHPTNTHPQKETAELAHSGAINALNPDHAKGFVTDLARYNALLGVNAYENGTDAESASEGQAELHADDSFSYAEFEPSSGSEAAAWEPELTDHAVVQAYLHGMDAAGLPAEYAPLVQQLYDQFGDPSAEWEVTAPAGGHPAENKYAAHHEPAGVVDDVTAEEYAQIRYMQQQSLAGQWSAPPPAYTHVPNAGVNVVVQQPQAAYPEAAKVAQMHGPATPQAAEADVDEDMYEHLLSLCLA